MKEVFCLCKDILSDDGTLWLNMGDSYAGSGKGRNADGSAHHTGKQATHKGSGYGLIPSFRRDRAVMPRQMSVDFLNGKNLIGQPWRLAFALQEQGWYLRQDIIWHKPNPMPESVKDRCTKAHEYMFLLTKSQKYYFDQSAIREPVSPNTHARLSQDVQKQIGSARANGGKKTNGNMKAVCRNLPNTGRIKNNSSFNEAMAIMPTDRNKRSVWTIPTESFREAHFATFPQALVEPCVLAGSRVGDTVFDPFLGSGTVAQVAQRLGRNWIGVELNPEYIELQKKRTCQIGMMI